MKDLLLRARVVVGTSNVKISRRPLEDHVKKPARRDYFSPFNRLEVIDLRRCRCGYCRHFLNSLLSRNQLVLSRKLRKKTVIQ